MIGELPDPLHDPGFYNASAPDVTVRPFSTR